MRKLALTKLAPHMRTLRGLVPRRRAPRGLVLRGFIPRIRPRKLLPRSRRAQRRTVQAVMLGCVLALARRPGCTRSRTAGSAPPPTSRALTSPSCSAPGCGRAGRPRIWRTGWTRPPSCTGPGKVKVVLVTGDNSRVEYDEPDAMRVYLTERGVPDGRIVSDYAGFDTWDSCVRAKKIFGVDRAVLVTQGFHIRRAVALCDAAGIESYGVGVAEPHDAVWYYGGTRELFAAGKAALDACSSPTRISSAPRSRVSRRRWRATPPGPEPVAHGATPGAGRAAYRGCNATGPPA